PATLPLGSNSGLGGRPVLPVPGLRRADLPVAGPVCLLPGPAGVTRAGAAPGVRPEAGQDSGGSECPRPGLFPSHGEDRRTVTGPPVGPLPARPAGEAVPTATTEGTRRLAAPPR